MGFLDRLFGKKIPMPRQHKQPAQTANPGIVNKKEAASRQQDKPSPPLQVPNEQWRQFFTTFPLHESARDVLVGFVKHWPTGLNPQILASQNVQAVLDRVRKYQSMPYPVKMLADIPDARPNYQMMDGKVARGSNQFLDMIICQVVPLGEKARPGDQPGHVVFRLIERYADLPLAKLVFLLPRVYDASKAAEQGKAAVVVIEDMLIQVYKGIENVLFDVYEELPEGGRLNEDLITRKLTSLLASA